MINTRFIFYKNKSTFDADKSTLNDRQIAFIAETCTIYTHGTEFKCLSEDVSIDTLNKLKFRLSGTVIQYSIDGGATWETLIDLNQVDWENVTNLKQIINNIVNQNVDLTDIENRLSTLETKVNNHETRITTLENNGGGSGEGSDYVLPTASSTTLGGIRIGFTEDNTSRDYPVKLNSQAEAYVHVPWEKGTGDGSGTDTPTTSKYKAFAFYTVRYDESTGDYNSTDLTAISTTPSGFNSTTSTPTDPSGCTDGPEVSHSKDLVYMTTAWVVDGQCGSWSDWALMKDTTDFDVCFHGGDTEPAAPTVHGSQNGAGGWYDDVSKITNGAKWMATSTLNNGVWSEWQVVRIQGEKGEDGTSINIRGELDGTRYTSISELTTLSNGNDKTVGLLLTDGTRYTGLAAGDCFKVSGGDLDGHIVCCVDDTPSYVWTDLGNIQGPAGNDGTSSHLHVKFSDDVQPDENGYASAGTFTNHPYGNIPGKYIGTLVDENVEASTNVSDYLWQVHKGEDGFGYQYIYCSLNEYIVNDSSFKTPKIDSSIDQITGSFFASKDGETVSKTQTLDVIWMDEQPNCDVNNPYIYRAYTLTTSDDDYFWGTKELNRYPVLVAQYTEPGEGSTSTKVEQAVYYILGDSSQASPSVPTLSSYYYSSGVTWYGIISNGWSTTIPTLSDDKPYLWKIIFTCYDFKYEDPKSSRRYYETVISSDPTLAAIKGIGSEANSTGADWVYKGDWNSNITYERTNTEIPYVSYGFVAVDSEHEETFVTDITSDTYGYVIQYWYLPAGTTESTGQTPSYNDDSPWEPFHTDLAVAYQFASIDKIVARKIDAAEISASQIKTGTLSANIINGGSVKASDVFICDENYKYGDGSQYPWVVGGMVSTTNDDDYALWVGSSIDGDQVSDEEIKEDAFTEYTSSVPFKVTKKGKLYATDAEISGNSNIVGTMSASRMFLKAGSGAVLFVKTASTIVNLSQIFSDDDGIELVYIIRIPQDITEFRNFTYTVSAGNSNSTIIVFNTKNDTEGRTQLGVSQDLTFNSDIVVVKVKINNYTMCFMNELNLSTATNVESGQFGQ